MTTAKNTDMTTITKSQLKKMIQEQVNKQHKQFVKESIQEITSTLPQFNWKFDSSGRGIALLDTTNSFGYELELTVDRTREYSVSGWRVFISDAKTDIEWTEQTGTSLPKVMAVAFKQARDVMMTSIKDMFGEIKQEYGV
jgi:hypothetical protein